MDRSIDTRRKAQENAEFARQQETVRCAKDIQQDFPEASWSECLVAAEQIMKRDPY